MCSNTACCSFPHGSKNVVLTASVLSILGTIFGSVNGGFLIGWLLAVFLSVVLFLTTCSPVNKGLLIAGGVCGIIAALCQLGSALLFTAICSVVNIFGSEAEAINQEYTEAYNDAIMNLGGDEDNFFIQNITASTEKEAEEFGGCGFLRFASIFGYISGVMLLVASIMALCIPAPQPVTNTEGEEQEVKPTSPASVPAVTGTVPEQAAAPEKADPYQ